MKIANSLLGLLSDNQKGTHCLVEFEAQWYAHRHADSAAQGMTDASIR